MTSSDLPSLGSLRALATVAETGSYSKAGAALNVSHAAIGQQVRALESRLGVTLVVREGRGIALTAEGRALARELASGFDIIRRGVAALTEADSKRPVQVTMSPAFAVRWMMPRITEFHSLYPEIGLMLYPTAAIVEPAPGGVDVAIRFCHGTWPGMDVASFLVPDIVVVGAPSLIGGRRANDPVLFTQLPWLQELGTNEVAEWLHRHHIIPSEGMKIIHMPGNLIMDAVRQGVGLTYTPRIFVDEDIRSGRLLELSSESDAGGFYLVTRSGVLRPAAQTFVTWLKRKVAHDHSRSS